MSANQLAANSLLQDFAIKCFDERELGYAIRREDVVEVSLKSESAGLAHITIMGDEPADRAAIAVIVLATPIAQFPGERREAALAVCNRLNHHAIGRFVVDEVGGMNHILRWPVTNNVWWQDFGQTLGAVLSDIDMFYGDIMAARFGL